MCLHYLKNKFAGLMFGGGTELVIRNFCRVNGFGLGSSHVSGVVWDRIVVDDGLSECGGLGEIVLLITLLVHDEAQ